MSLNQLWVERHRPTDIDDYVFTDPSVRTQVEHWIADKNFPHLLLHGPAGTGKTTLAKLLIHNIGVEDLDIMIANGSKEGRKIEWVDRLIGFCQTMPFGPFKVVLIDEADYLNRESVQPAMRNLMEDFSQSVRFILTCNYPGRIIPPLKSRCHEIRIDRTDQTEFTARAATVLVQENVEFDLDCLDSYVKATYPDLRKCINLMQANSNNNRLAEPNNDVSGTNDYRLSVVDLLKKGQTKAARKLIIEQTRAEEVEDFFRWTYDNLDLWSNSEEGQDEAILVIRRGLVNNNSCADHEINLSATLVELLSIGK
jgi:DNA polymerase III delta prime subunit